MEQAKICTFIVAVFLLGLNEMGNSQSIILNSDLLHRSKRQLLFLNQSFLQVNVGVSTPTAFKMVNVNWAIQAQFTLPWNRTLIPDDILDANSGYVGTSRGKRDTDEVPRIQEYENDAKLYHFYKYVEDSLNGYGHNGTSCILKAFCQLGAEPLQTVGEEDLLHELASYILTPSNDHTSQAAPQESSVYIQAHDQGKNNEDCTKIYEDCRISLVDLFSYTYDPS